MSVEKHVYANPEQYPDMGFLFDIRNNGIVSHEISFPEIIFFRSTDISRLLNHMSDWQRIHIKIHFRTILCLIRIIFKYPFISLPLWFIMLHPAKATKGVSLTEEELQKKRTEAIEKYIALLKSDNLTFRWKAAEILGNMHAAEAVGPLIESLRDEYVDVSWIAAKSLGKIGDKRATIPLIDCLDSKEQWLRKGAATGLGLLKDKRAVVHLIRLLEDKKPKVRIAAIKALVLIGDKRATEPLSRCIKDRNKKVKKEAVEAIVAFRGDEAIKILNESLNDPDIKDAVEQAIRKIKKT